VRAGSARRPRSYWWIVAVLVALGVAIAALGISVDLLASRTAVTPIPIAAGIWANTTTGDHPLFVSFKANVSGGVAPYSYAWNFGDGGTASGPTAHHTFATRGEFNVSLLATDSNGRAAVANLTLTALATPQFATVANLSEAPLGAGVSSAWILSVPIPNGSLSAWLNGTVNITACPHDHHCKIEAEVLSLAGLTAFLQGVAVQPIWCSEVDSACGAVTSVVVAANLTAWQGVTVYLVVWNPDPQHVLLVSAVVMLNLVD
jgi:PKD domain-containing protein